MTLLYTLLPFPNYSSRAQRLKTGSFPPSFGGNLTGKPEQSVPFNTFALPQTDHSKAIIPFIISPACSKSAKVGSGGGNPARKKEPRIAVATGRISG